MPNTLVYSNSQHFLEKRKPKHCNAGRQQWDSHTDGQSPQREESDIVFDLHRCSFSQKGVGGTEVIQLTANWMIRFGDILLDLLSAKRLRCSWNIKNTSKKQCVPWTLSFRAAADFWLRIAGGSSEGCHKVSANGLAYFSSFLRNNGTKREALLISTGLANSQRCKRLGGFSNIAQ